MTIMADPAHIAEFALAGRATLTLKSLRTGDHFSYRISRKEDRVTREPIWFVSWRTGPEHPWQYLGMIRGGQFAWTKASLHRRDEPAYVAFEWFHRRVIAQRQLPVSLEVRHMNHCGRCGRQLTDPTSIDRGIGPECWEKRHAA